MSMGKPLEDHPDWVSRDAACAVEEAVDYLIDTFFSENLPMVTRYGDQIATLATRRVYEVVEATCVAVENGALMQNA